MEPEKKIKTIIVKKELCLGAACCIITAGSVFEFNSESKAFIKQKQNLKNYGPAERQNLEDQKVTDETLFLAAQSCPVKAIILLDKEGKQVYP